MASLNARVVDVEKSTGDLKLRIDDLDHHLEDVQQQLGALEAEDSEVREDVKATLDILKLEFCREVEDLRGIIRSELATLRAQVERVKREQAITRDQLEEVRTDMGVCKRAVANGVSIGATTPKVEIPILQPLMAREKLE